MKKHILSFMAASLITISSISSAYAGGPASDNSSDKSAHIRPSDEKDINTSHARHGKSQAREELIKKMESLNLSNEQRVNLEREMSKHKDTLRAIRALHRHNIKKADCPKEIAVTQESKELIEPPVSPYDEVMAGELTKKETSHKGCKFTKQEMTDIITARKFIAKEKERHISVVKSILTDEQFAQYKTITRTNR